ncbi:MAG: hypothetical protein GQ474_01185 [Sulfurimonas sp.]|nr:hypothetical protein [Sulfurimonas sp.]
MTSCGTKILLGMFHNYNATIREANLSTPWDITTAVMNAELYTETGATNLESVNALTISPDGKHVYANCLRYGSSVDFIVQFDAPSTLNGTTSYGTYDMDTTAITQGEVPSKVFRTDVKVSLKSDIDFIELIEKNRTNALTVINLKDVLTSRITYEALAVDSKRTLTTKIALSTVGNKMKKLSFDVLEPL